MTVATAQAAADVATGKAAALNAPLFRQLVEALNRQRRQVVLDLGAASTPMLGLLGRSPCLVEIADLGSGDAIARLNAAEPAAAMSLAESLLPAHRPGEAVDAVFCWDLPNYLQPAALSALMAAVAARSGRGARAHLLIHYSYPSMPAVPARLQPTEDCCLVDRAMPGSSSAAPRYSPEDLGRMMAGFEIESARLLANGMQEFLLQLRA